MKNRDIITRRLEKADGQVEKLNYFLQRGGSVEEVKEVLTVLKEAIQDAKSFVQQEPLGSNEING